MLLFLVLAATLVLLAIAIVAIPLLRGEKAAPWAALASVAVLLLGSATGPGRKRRLPPRPRPWSLGSRDGSSESRTTSTAG